jgi:uncharacterized membrane protein
MTEFKLFLIRFFALFTALALVVTISINFLIILFVTIHIVTAGFSKIWVWVLLMSLLSLVVITSSLLSMNDEVFKPLLFLLCENKKKQWCDKQKANENDN